MILPRRRALVLLLAAALLALAACDSAGDVGGAATVQDSWLPDGAAADVGADAGMGETTAETVQDTGPSPDTGADAVQSDYRDDEAPFIEPLEQFFHPPPGAIRASLTVSATRAAWVERDAADGPPRIVLWPLDGDTPPQTFDLPYLAEPAHLDLGAEWLVYEDTRYGDPDIFAVRLSDGSESPVVTRPRAQRWPSVAGNWVVWQDCRDCVPTAESEGAADIYLRDMETGAELQVTASAAGDRRPVLATLIDGSRAVAWVEGTGTLRVVSPPALPVPVVDFSHDTGEPVDAVALSGGYLAWRPSPTIINPDTMMPSDVFRTSLASGATDAMTVHAVVTGAVDAAPRAESNRAAWLEAVAGESASLRRVRIVHLGTQAPVLEVVVPEARDLALGPDHYGFVAPSDENGGEDDIWLAPIR